MYQNSHCYARYDRYPVSKGHLLIIPFRHVENFFDLSQDERQTAFGLVGEAKRKLDTDFQPDGFNIGVNVGVAAGQTVSHVHIHLIPRYHGDVDQPEGGVRGVIPKMRRYRGAEDCRG